MTVPGRAREDNVSRTFNTTNIHKRASEFASFQSSWVLRWSFERSTVLISESTLPIVCIPWSILLYYKYVMTSPFTAPHSMWCCVMGTFEYNQLYPATAWSRRNGAWTYGVCLCALTFGWCPKVYKYEYSYTRMLVGSIIFLYATWPQRRAVTFRLYFMDVISLQ